MVMATRILAWKGRLDPRVLCRHSSRGIASPVLSLPRIRLNDSHRQPQTRRGPAFERIASYCTFHNTPIVSAEIMSTTPSTTKNPDEYRLPTDVRPTHYDLTIRTDLEKETFDGAVKIE